MERFVYNGKFIRVSEEFKENQLWERCYLNSGVIIYAINNEGKFLLIRERRPHEDEPIRLRFVAGYLEEGQSVEENANRELQEEVGYRARKTHHFFQIKSSGTINNAVHFVLAEDLIHDPIPNPDGDIVLGIEYYTKEELMQMILSDQMRWSNAVLGFLRLVHMKLI